MLRLAVCDDNNLFLEETSRLLKEDSRVEEVTLYSDPEELLRDVEDHKKEFDAIFMDIEYDDKDNGIEYIKKVYQEAPQIQVVYVTGYHDRYSQHIFLSEANLTGYLTKPIDKELLYQYLDKICRKQETKKILRFSVRGKEHIILTDNIWFLESDNHKTLIYADDQVYSVYDKLDNFKDRLPSVFLKCHKSYLINMDHISYIEGNSIRLENGQQIPISKVHQDMVRKNYFAYIGETL